MGESYITHFYITFGKYNLEQSGNNTASVSTVDFFFHLVTKVVTFDPSPPRTSALFFPMVLNVADPLPFISHSEMTHCV